MIKKLILDEQDLRKHLFETADKNPIINLPTEYPCLLFGECYRFHNGDFRRMLDFVYKKDCWGLFNQLEDNNGKERIRSENVS